LHLRALLPSVRSADGFRHGPLPAAYGAGGGGAGGGGGLIGIGTVKNGKCRYIVSGGRWYCGYCGGGAGAAGGSGGGAAGAGGGAAGAGACAGAGTDSGARRVGA
jgi:hypothetical protein